MRPLKPVSLGLIVVLVLIILTAGLCGLVGRGTVLFAAVPLVLAVVVEQLMPPEEGPYL